MLAGPHDTPMWSPDGRVLVVVDRADCVLAFFAWDAARRELRETASLTSRSFSPTPTDCELALPAWSPDGTSLAVIAGHGRLEVFAVPPAAYAAPRGGPPGPITTSARDLASARIGALFRYARPVWLSPTTIAAVGGDDADAADAGQLAGIDVGSGRQSVLVRFPAGGGGICAMAGLPASGVVVFDRCMRSYDGSYPDGLFTYRYATASAVA